MVRSVAIGPVFQKMIPSPVLVWLALVHLLELDDVCVAEVDLPPEAVGADPALLGDDGQEAAVVALGEGGRGVVHDRIVVVGLAVRRGVSDGMKPMKQKCILNTAQNVTVLVVYFFFLQKTSVLLATLCYS